MLCVVLVVDGREVRSVTSRSAPPTGRHDWTDVLTPVSFDVVELEGRTARLVIRDNHHNGYVLVDEIVLSDRTAGDLPIRDVPRWMEAMIEMPVDRPYLMMPVCQTAPLQELALEIDGTCVLEFTLQLALTDIDGFVPIYDLTSYLGGTLSLRYHTFSSDADAPDLQLVDGISSARALRASAGAADGAHHPGFHISPSIGFLNDPNGLLYADGVYHLFHQYAVLNMRSSHWAHWVSTDLVHWEERPIALFPDALGSMHSGSAVVDHGNTAGFGRPGTTESPIVAIFTGSRGMGGTRKIQVQGLAYSLDSGRTFRKYGGNPVIGLERSRIMTTDNNRDPKVFWYEPASHWVMVLYERKGLSIFTSADLKNWEFQSHEEGFHECPELFELPIGGTHGSAASLLCLDCVHSFEITPKMR
jgi:fructan beta-fructosidase